MKKYEEINNPTYPLKALSENIGKPVSGFAFSDDGEKWIETPLCGYDAENKRCPWRAACNIFPYIARVKEVVTTRELFNQLPGGWREAAMEQAEPRALDIEWYPETSVWDVFVKHSVLDWDKTREGFDEWSKLWEALRYGKELPPYPYPEKTVCEWLEELPSLVHERALGQMHSEVEKIAFQTTNGVIYKKAFNDKKLSDLKNSRINKYIAKLCGWTNIREDVEDASGQFSGTKNGVRDIIPSYTTDLNAIHEAEQEVILKRGLGKTFAKNLYDVINSKPVDEIGYEYDDLVTEEEVACLRIHATATQRAEALLRTVEN